MWAAPLLSRWPTYLVRLGTLLAVIIVLVFTGLNTFWFSVYIPRLQSLLWSDPAVTARLLGFPVLATADRAAPTHPSVIWTVSGVFVGPSPLALLVVQGQTHVVRVGDVLFDGGSVQQIRHDAVLLSYPTGTRVIPVFSSQGGQ